MFIQTWSLSYAITCFQDSLVVTKHTKRDIIDHVTNPFAIGHFLLVDRSIGTEPLSLTIYEIFASKYISLTTLTF